MIEIRRSEDRGTGGVGWLKSRYAFSFAGYHDARRMGLGPLRVFNEDTLAPNRGYGQHAHHDMEIVSCVLEGELAYQDSLGNLATLRPGSVRRISAGRGIRFAEFNPSRTELLRALQIWIVPRHKGGTARCEQLSFERCSRMPSIRTLIGATEDGALAIDHDVRLSVATLPARGGPLQVDLKQGRVAYLHVVRGNLALSGRRMREGDAATVSNERQILFDRADDAEVLVIDLPANPARKTASKPGDGDHSPARRASIALALATLLTAALGYAVALQTAALPRSPRGSSPSMQAVAAELKNVRRAGSDDDPPSIAPAQLWPAQW